MWNYPPSQGPGPPGPPGFQPPHGAWPPPPHHGGPYPPYGPPQVRPFPYALPGQPPPWGVPPARSRHPFVVAGAVLAGVVALAVVAVLGAVLAPKTTGSGSASPEDQVKAVVKGIDDGLNNADAARLTSLVCAEKKSSDGFRAKTNAELRQQRARKGTVTSTVASINVTGDRATATIHHAWSKAPGQADTDTDVFVRESGGWKICGGTKSVSS